MRLRSAPPGEEPAPRSARRWGSTSRPWPSPTARRRRGASTGRRSATSSPGSRRPARGRPTPTSTTAWPTASWATCGALAPPGGAAGRPHGVPVRHRAQALCSAAPSPSPARAARPSRRAEWATALAASAPASHVLPGLRRGRRRPARRCSWAAILVISAPAGRVGRPGRARRPPAGPPARGGCARPSDLPLPGSAGPSFRRCGRRGHTQLAPDATAGGAGVRSGAAPDGACRSPAAARSRAASSTSGA